MITKIYSIYDTASAVYNKPLFLISDGQALRLFSDLATAADNDIGKHPEDYTLFRIGEFNDNYGKITPQAPESLATALEMVAASRKVNGSKMNALADQVELEMQEGNTRLTGDNTNA